MEVLLLILAGVLILMSTYIAIYYAILYRNEVRKNIQQSQAPLVVKSAIYNVSELTYRFKISPDCIPSHEEFVKKQNINSFLLEEVSKYVEICEIDNPFIIEKEFQVKLYLCKV